MIFWREGGYKERRLLCLRQAFQFEKNILPVAVLQHPCAPTLDADTSNLRGHNCQLFYARLIPQVVQIIFFFLNKIPCDRSL